MASMLHIGVPSGVSEIVIRTTCVYLFLLLGVRIAGKREIGQITPFDLVILLLISNSVQNAMTGGDNSLTGGLISAGVLLTLNAAVALVRMRSDGLRRFIEGVPTVLVTHGQIQYRPLAKEHMTVEELQAALRQHEVTRVEDVELAMLEVDGSISVIRKDPDHPAAVVHSRKRLVHHHKAGDA